MKELIDELGKTFEEIEFTGEIKLRCKECAFNSLKWMSGVSFYDCLADEYGMSPCIDRLDGKVVYFKKVS